MGGSCRFCRKTLLKSVSDDGQGGVSVSLIEPPPTANDPPPRSVVDAIEEAATCASCGALLGAALLLRRAVELIAVDQGADRSTRLRDQIEYLESEGLLPTGFETAAEGIRELGNEAAHRDTSHWESPKPGELSGAERVGHWLGMAQAMVGWFYQPDDVIAALDQVHAASPPRTDP